MFIYFNIQNAFTATQWGTFEWLPKLNGYLILGKYYALANSNDSWIHLGNILVGNFTFGNVIQSLLFSIALSFSLTWNRYQTLYVPLVPFVLKCRQDPSLKLLTYICNYNNVKSGGISLFQERILNITVTFPLKGYELIHYFAPYMYLFCTGETD